MPGCFLCEIEEQPPKQGGHLDLIPFHGSTPRCVKLNKTPCRTLTNRPPMK